MRCPDYSSVLTSSPKKYFSLYHHGCLQFGSKPTSVTFSLIICMKCRKTIAKQQKHTLYVCMLWISWAWTSTSYDAITIPLLDCIIEIVQKHTKIENTKGILVPCINRFVIGITPTGVNISYSPSARAVVGEYRPEVLTVWTKHSEVCTKKTEIYYTTEKSIEDLSQIPCNIMWKMFISLYVLSVSTAGAGSPSFVMLLKICNSRLKQGFSKSAIHSGVLQWNFRKILSLSTLLISSSKGHKCGIIWDNAIEHFDWLILVIGPLTAWVV